jgi:hypothetical protein
MPSVIEQLAAAKKHARINGDSFIRVPFPLLAEIVGELLGRHDMKSDLKQEKARMSEVAE